MTCLLTVVRQLLSTVLSASLNANYFTPRMLITSSNSRLSRLRFRFFCLDLSARHKLVLIDWLHVLRDFGELWSTFSAAWIIHSRYLAHFLSYDDKIWHDQGSGKLTLISRISWTFVRGSRNTMQQHALVLHWCSCFLLVFRRWTGGMQSSLTFSLAWRWRRGCRLVEIKDSQYYNLLVRFRTFWTLIYTCTSDSIVVRVCVVSLLLFRIYRQHRDVIRFVMDCHRHSVFISVQCFFLALFQR